MFMFFDFVILLHSAHVSVSLCCSTVASNTYRNPTTKATTIPVEKAEVERRET